MMVDETKAILALEMRRKGDGYAQIAGALGITESEAIEAVAVLLESQAREDEKVTIRLNLENLEKMLSKLGEKARDGDQAAVERVLKLLGTIDELQKRLGALMRAEMVPAFPAPAETPGQGTSRNAYAVFVAQKENCPWWDVYLRLREKWDWRKAAFIAWSVMPSERRLPSTQHALAIEVLGLKDDRVLRKWRENDPEIEKDIEMARMGVAGDALNDVLAAWVGVARLLEPAAHQDRKTYLEWAGVYKGQGIRLGGMEGNPVGVEHSLAGLEDGELEGVIANLLVVSGQLSVVSEGVDDGEHQPTNDD